MRRIRRGLLLCFILFTSSPPIPAQAASDVDWLLAQINCLRQSIGVAPLTINAALTSSATTQSAYLSSHSITDFHVQPDGSTPQSRAEAAGYKGYVGENVVGGASVAQAFSWWRGDDIHYRNMINAYWSDVGIGIVNGSHGTWYTLDFGTRAWQLHRITAASCGSSSVPTSVSKAPSAGSAAASSNPATARPAAVADSLDAQGNIKHQVQAGETLGHIALMYGYSWADIPGLLALNHMTGSDFRRLKIGSIFLIPTRSGPFTPQPATSTETPVITATLPAVTAIVVVTTQTETPTGGPSSSNSATPAWTLSLTDAASPALPTAQSTTVSIPTVIGTTALALVTISAVPDIYPAPSVTSNASSDDPIRTLLKWAIVAQGMVLGGWFLRFLWRQR